MQRWLNKQFWSSGERSGRNHKFIISNPELLRPFLQTRSSWSSLSKWQFHSSRCSGQRPGCHSRLLFLSTPTSSLSGNPVDLTSKYIQHLLSLLPSNASHHHFSLDSSITSPPGAPSACPQHNSQRDTIKLQVCSETSRGSPFHSGWTPTSSQRPARLARIWPPPVTSVTPFLTALLLSCSTPVTLASLPFLEHTRHSTASVPLQLLFLLHGSFSCLLDLKSGITCLY